jgi:hypothetical protein
MGLGIAQGEETSLWSLLFSIGRLRC